MLPIHMLKNSKELLLFCTTVCPEYLCIFILVGVRKLNTIYGTGSIYNMSKNSFYSAYQYKFDKTSWTCSKTRPVARFRTQKHTPISHRHIIHFCESGLSQVWIWTRICEPGNQVRWQLRIRCGNLTSLRHLFTSRAVAKWISLKDMFSLTHARRGLIYTM